MHLSIRLFNPFVLGLLISCGGGEVTTSTENLGTTSITVIGDSLSDSGTFEGAPGFGRIFSIQGSDSEPNVLWSERIAEAFGSPGLCNFYSFTGSAFNVDLSCTSFAVGGSRINNLQNLGGPESPFSIKQQLSTAAFVKKRYNEGDIILIGGGSNDAFDLAIAYMRSYEDKSNVFRDYIGTIVDVSDLALLSDEQAGAYYMQLLADKLFSEIKLYGVEYGANHIVALNIPNIISTPRMQLILSKIEESVGSGARSEMENLLRNWILAFNLRLANNANHTQEILVVDFFVSLENQTKNPANFGLSNVSAPACPATGIDDKGLPNFNLESCIASNLSKSPPFDGMDSNWWKSYAFSDDFHPTPYGHKLLSAVVVNSLNEAGWFPRKITGPRELQR